MTSFQKLAERRDYEAAVSLAKKNNTIDNFIWFMNVTFINFSDDNKKSDIVKMFQYFEINLPEHWLVVSFSWLLGELLHENDDERFMYYLEDAVTSMAAMKFDTHGLKWVCDTFEDFFNSFSSNCDIYVKASSYVVKRMVEMGLPVKIEPMLETPDVMKRVMRDKKWFESLPADKQLLLL